MEGYKPRVKITKVIWKPPHRDWIICNTDGASRGNPSRGLYGFCARNEERDIVQAQVEELGHITNIEAEAIAIWEALKWCEMTQRRQIIIQTDSLILQKILNDKWKPPWSIVEYIERIKQLVEDK
ncbi:uncharacterized protein LOC132612004 [Lycium barbarum]|uniref:uncharacterized protein LOC132612004 n=1 Tax=Lycium barbarum TaxID=112863 RepID=UPI00293F3A07|nr:uncharacterized protein LOC132612004 [Lycium barbarum]